jgi:hypothetical protein
MSKDKTTTELVIRRKHLDDHRRTIIARSLAAAVASAVPVPLLDDWVRGAVLRSTYRKLAAAYQIDVEEDALRNLVHGRVDPPDLGKLVTDATVLTVLRRNWRRLVVLLAAARRVQATARYFTMATLFDHYCAKMHVGLGIDSVTGLELRFIMDRAIAETEGGLGHHLFRRGIAAAARATLRAPAELVDIATAGMLRRLLARRQQGQDSLEIAAAQEVDAILEQQLAEEQSFLARATRAIELQLSVQGNPYLDALIDNFERLWRQRHKPDTTP